jgi:hypothetical protein
MTFYHFSLAMFVVLGVLLCDSAGCRETRVVGGDCVYKTYKGTATITEVTPLEREGDATQKVFQVKFVFTSSEAIQESFAQVAGREFELVAYDYSNFSKASLEKHGIEKGCKLDCYLNVITHGACTPTIFEFPALKRDEYNVK